ncbi:ferredoxin [Herbihabitans rhizosphaerae]|nr:(4Fe-4S)-binding protein [Herbihabitans rhizosphaerae]
MRINADRDVCVGAGQCVLTDDAIFDQDDAEGTVVVLSEHVDGEALEHARTAVDICPSGALSLSDD